MIPTLEDKFIRFAKQSTNPALNLLALIQSLEIDDEALFDRLSRDVMDLATMPPEIGTPLVLGALTQLEAAADLEKRRREEKAKQNREKLEPPSEQAEGEVASD